MEQSVGVRISPSALKKGNSIYFGFFFDLRKQCGIRRGTLNNIWVKIREQAQLKIVLPQIVPS